MAQTTTGHPPDNKEKRRTLAPRFHRAENMLAGIQGIEDRNVDEIRRFSNALITARDAWADRERFDRRYSDAQEARTFGTVLKSGGAR